MVRIPCALCLGPGGFNSVPGRGTKIPTSCAGWPGEKKGKKKKKTTAAVTTIKNPTQNGSTFGSVLTKAVHVIINTPNFFSSFGGKQKWNLSRFPLGTNM